MYCTLPWDTDIWLFYSRASAKRWGVCLRWSQSVIFLQPALFPLLHKSLSYVLAVCPFIYTSGKAHTHGVILKQLNNFEMVIFCKTGRNWRVHSLCCLDPWGQGQEGSRRTQRQAGTEVVIFFLNQPQIMRFSVFYRRERDTIISEHLFILYYYKSVFIFRLFIYLGNHARIPQNV